MRIVKIDEVPEWKKDNICIRVSGLDLKFQASNYSLSLFIDEDEADKIAFQLNAILQDRDITKKELDKTKIV